MAYNYSKFKHIKFYTLLKWCPWQRLKQATLLVATAQVEDTDIVKEEVNSIGAGLLDGSIQRLHCFVVEGSIKPQAL